MYGQITQIDYGSFLLTPLREGRLLALAQMVSLEAISTHAPARGATRLRGAGRGAGNNFYSRPCERGDEAARELDSAMSISTHAPARGATTAFSAQSPSAILFLLTPLREGRLPYGLGRRKAHHHFYSRPCERGDIKLGIRVFKLRISTHAPARGATKDFQSFAIQRKISTHAPARGATRIPRVLCVMLLSISTHAPARGATLWHTEPESAGRDYFYSRPCERGDPRAHHRLRGRRNFYSRPCERGDRTPGEMGWRYRISTHAPARGATPTS